MVRFVATGTSVQRGKALVGDAALDSATAELERDLMRDAGAVLSHVTCPSCGQRAPGAVVWCMVRVMLWLGPAALCLELSLFIATVLAVLAAAQITAEIFRARRAGRAMFTRIRTSRLPRPATPDEKPPRAELPVARAVNAPPWTAVPPPVESSPPPRLEPPSPGAEPKILRSKV